MPKKLFFFFNAAFIRKNYSFFCLLFPYCAQRGKEKGMESSSLPASCPSRESSRWGTRGCTSVSQTPREHRGDGREGLLVRRGGPTPTFFHPKPTLLALCISDSLGLAQQRSNSTTNIMTIFSILGWKGGGPREWGWSVQAGGLSGADSCNKYLQSNYRYLKSGIQFEKKPNGVRISIFLI